MTVRFKIEYHTEWGQSLSVVIADVKHEMHWGEGGKWSVTVDGLSPEDLLDYTYVVMRDSLIERPEWDHHRLVTLPQENPSDGTLDIEDRWIDCPFEGCRFPRRHSASKFDTPGFRGAGTVIPVFSLRSRDDFGIGEFKDLIPLVDWAAGTGQSVIQLLPVTDTTRCGQWEDSYPYSPVSSFALNPMYISLGRLGAVLDDGSEKLRKELNDLPEIDYPRVFEAKTGILRKVFTMRGPADLATEEFLAFRKENACWIDEYSSFCERRDGTLPKEFYEWVQFHLDAQFTQVADYARSKGISLKGDLPIGVSGDSADAYWHPELFNLDSSTGAPPDFFSADGQNWGFPTYNWESMASDDFLWWKRRLRKMARWFDAYRIDHILGFFRIWEIPCGCSSGRYGHFNPALAYTPWEIAAAGIPQEGLFVQDPRNPGKYQPMIAPQRPESVSDAQWSRFQALHDDFFFRRNEAFWRRNAMRKIPELLGATGMLACGEDLGMVPDCVDGVMRKEAVLSLEMPGFDKGRPWPECAVCATSSHDMETLRMRLAREKRERPGSTEPCSYDPSGSEIRDVLRGTLSAAPMLAIFPLQDWVALDEGFRRPDFAAERINEPADPHHHWRFRLHFDVSGLEEQKGLCETVASLLKETGRYITSPSSSIAR